MGLKTYIVKRTIYSFIVLFLLMTTNFIIFNLMPGDPLAQYTQNLEGRVTPDQIRELRKLYGLDLAMHERYLHYLVNTLRFEFGRSRETRIPIVEEIAARLGNTIILMGTSLVFAITIGTLIGTLLASRRGGKIDTIGTTSVLILGSLPVFWIGLLILTFFAVQLKWFPIGGSQPMEWAVTGIPTDPLEYIKGRLWCLVLPALTLFIFTVDGWALLTRQCILQVITEDYVITARAKGLKERTVLLKHVLKPASLPLVTAMALSFAGIFSGAIITETVFSYEGMGRYAMRIISTTDLPGLYAFFYISGLLVIVANFLVDLIYGFIDPRIKVGG